MSDFQSFQQVPSLFGVSHGALQFMAYEEIRKKWSKHLAKRNKSAEMVLLPLSLCVCVSPPPINKQNAYGRANKQAQRFAKSNVVTLFFPASMLVGLHSNLQHH